MQAQWPDRLNWLARRRPKTLGFWSALYFLKYVFGRFLPLFLRGKTFNLVDIRQKCLKLRHFCRPQKGGKILFFVRILDLRFYGGVGDNLFFEVAPPGVWEISAKLRFAVLRVVSWCLGDRLGNFTLRRNFQWMPLHGAHFDRCRQKAALRVVFSKYRLHGDISSATYTVAQSKNYLIFLIFDLVEVVSKFFALKAKNLRTKYALHGHIS